jgi:hypothetical protein
MRPLPALLGALAVLLALLWTGPAQAQGAALDGYRASGVIAERFDGYVEIRDPNAPADARALVDQVNAQRRALYQKRAQESNVPVEEVGKLFATKITETAPPGTYFRQPGGGFVRK